MVEELYRKVLCSVAMKRRHCELSDAAPVVLRDDHDDDDDDDDDEDEDEEVVVARANKNKNGRRRLVVAVLCIVATIHLCSTFGTISTRCFSGGIACSNIVQNNRSNLAGDFTMKEEATLLHSNTHGIKGSNVTSMPTGSPNQNPLHNLLQQAKDAVVHTVSKVAGKHQSLLQNHQLKRVVHRDKSLLHGTYSTSSKRTVRHGSKLKRPLTAKRKNPLSRIIVGNGRRRRRRGGQQQQHHQLSSRGRRRRTHTRGEYQLTSFQSGGDEKTRALNNMMKEVKPGPRGKVTGTTKDGKMLRKGERCMNGSECRNGACARLTEFHKQVMVCCRSGRVQYSKFTMGFVCIHSQRDNHGCTSDVFCQSQRCSIIINNKWKKCQARAAKPLPTDRRCVKHGHCQRDACAYRFLRPVSNTTAKNPVRELSEYKVCCPTNMYYYNLGYKRWVCAEENETPRCRTFEQIQQLERNPRISNRRFYTDCGGKSVYCVNGVCAKGRLVDGEACQSFRDCQSDVCEYENEDKNKMNKVCCTGDGFRWSVTLGEYACTGMQTPGGTCSDTRFCKKGLECDEKTRTCVSPKKR